MAYSDRERQRAFARRHYQENKEVYKARAREQKHKLRAENKVFVLEYLRSHPCVDCGNTDIRVLQFDHVNRNTKTSPISRLLASTTKLKQEIDKCDVRCANCHMIRTAEQFGWTRLL